MSGKTTLLRTVGTNTVLAQAGAPVRAKRLRLSPLAVGATIQVHDSLQAGRSRFYAEINRLKQLMDLTGEEGTALLFLLDEILHGTNSHDRQIGARALLGELINAGAIGLVTTHDLALADAGPACAGKIENVHFSDQVVDGELVFDYSLRPGVVRGSNAIVLMRAVGLELGDIDA
jgi:DNA mismatch repair ATPase MutS